MELDLPLISPLSRKYYNYATESDSRKHHRAEDVRICLEFICDEIIIEFVKEEDKNKWSEYNLHEKLKASRHFLSKKVVQGLIEAKIIGNKGVHQGEEGNYGERDLEKTTDAIRDFSLAVFLSFFKTNGFAPKQKSWIPTVFSTLPPIYRVKILEEYYLLDQSTFVIDKLSKALLKSGEEEQANTFLGECHARNELSDIQYEVLLKDILLLKQSFDKLPIATNLEEAQKNFNNLLPAIDKSERDSFVCLVSMILNGYHPEKN